MKLSRIQIIVLELIIVAVIGLAPALSTLFQVITIPSSATIKAIGVAFYWNPAATEQVTNITWGLVNPGASYSMLTYCENIKNSNATMKLTVNAWNPTNADTYVSAGWNYTGAIIHPGAIIPILFELQLFPNATAITSFSFNYVANATAQ